MYKNNLFQSLVVVGLLLGGGTTFAASILGDQPVVLEYPEGELGRMVKLGEEIMAHTNTHPLSARYVANKLTCKNCHPAGSDGRAGSRTTPTSSLLGAAAVYPAFSAKQGTIISLQDRISDCFMDCMSGPRSPVDSDVNMALTAYVTWLSHSHKIKMNPHQPVSMITDETWSKGKEKFAGIQKQATHQNYLSGQKIYQEKCASCHGKQGQGTVAGPPLWGKDKQGNWLAYDANSGLASLHKAGTWIQQNMPFGQEGTLGDQESADVALYLCAQPKEAFDTQKALRLTKGLYRSKHPNRTETVRNQFNKFGLDIDEIRGDHVIP